MFVALQNPLSLIGRVLLALLFIPAGFSKIGGFAGTASYIASKGVPFPELAAAAAVGVELGLGLLLLIGWQTRWAALGIAFSQWSSRLSFTISGLCRPSWSCPSSSLSSRISPWWAAC